MLKSQEKNSSEESIASPTINIQVPKPKSHLLANSAIGLGGLGALGAGAGLLAGKKIENIGQQGINTTTPEGRELLKKFMQGTRESVPDKEKLKQFIEGGHDILSNNIFNIKNKNVSGYDVLDDLYKNPLTAEVIKKINPDFQGMNAGTREHYREFSKSPLDAYKQLLKEQYGDRHVNSYMDRMHDARMRAVYKHRADSSKSYLQHLAEELQGLEENPAGLGREIKTKTNKGSREYRKALDMEIRLRKADPKAYNEWRRIARVSNPGEMLDPQAEQSLKDLAKHIYGKANTGEDLAHNTSAFKKSLKESLRTHNISGDRLKKILDSGNFSDLTRAEQSKILEHLINNGPKLQTEHLAEDIAKSFSGGRAGYRGLAGTAIKFDELAHKLRDKGKALARYGKHGLAAGAGLTGLGLLGRYFNREPEYANYQVNLPGYELTKKSNHMNTQQAYIEGFIKRAAQYGLDAKEAVELFKEAEKPGLWANIRAKRARGEKAAKPGDKDYPDKEQWNKLTKESESSPAWQRSEGKNPEGGLNAKGRASYKRETGGTLKAPVTESKPKGERAKRRNSFCSRMCGMKRVNTGSEAKSDPDSRINKSLRKWNCKCGEAHDTLIEKIACNLK